MVVLDCASVDSTYESIQTSFGLSRQEIDKVFARSTLTNFIPRTAVIRTTLLTLCTKKLGPSLFLLHSLMLFAGFICLALYHLVVSRADSSV